MICRTGFFAAAYLLNSPATRFDAQDQYRRGSKTRGAQSEYSGVVNPADDVTDHDRAADGADMTEGRSQARVRPSLPIEIELRPRVRFKPVAVGHLDLGQGGCVHRLGRFDDLGLR